MAGHGRRGGGTRDGHRRAARWGAARRHPATATLLAGAGHLADLVLPRECGGCLRPGSHWCGRCELALAELSFGLGAGHVGGGSWVVPHPAPPGLPPVHAWGVYADPLRAVVSAWKDAGRRDLAGVLAPLLAHSLAGAVAGSGWGEGVALVVPAPSSGRAVRERGDTPIVALCEAALGRLGDRSSPVLRVAPALAHRRGVADQSGLDTAQRRGNLEGAMTVKPLWDRVVRGRHCLLVDDVVTTGATLAEAARALRQAGALGVVAATMAATQRTRG